MNQCQFCILIAEKNQAIYYEDPSGLFAVMWSSLPEFPGHSLVIPKRHFARFRDMNQQEMQTIALVVSEAKSHIEQADLKAVYQNLEIISPDSQAKIKQAQAMIEQQRNLPPQAFNDGINDGPEAGQTIPHMHWHILPRWDNSAGDIVDQFKNQNL